MKLHKTAFWLIFLIIFSTFLLILYKNTKPADYLFFSDAAKYSDIARNLVHGNGYDSGFSFWSGSFVPYVKPVVPLSVAASFKLFGVSDRAVVLVSELFFILLVVTVYLLAKKLFGNLVGVLSAITVSSNLNMLNYAASGASEVIFSLEIVLMVYLFVLKSKASTIFGFVVLILMYFTRPQAIIYILGGILLMLSLNYFKKKIIPFFMIISFFMLTLFLYSNKQGQIAITQSQPGLSSSNLLRETTEKLDYVDLGKKLFYNLYNFYKLLPEILSPYLAGFFFLGILVREKKQKTQSFKIVTLFVVTLTLIGTAITIPLFRYLHPIVPLVYIYAIWTIVRLLKLAYDNRLPIKSKRFVLASAWFLILVFSVGQALGVLLLDSRYELKLKNIAMPPVYVQLALKLKEVTNSSSLVVTNLDTWGTWYGERKTVWFPLEPEMLERSKTGEAPFDVIYLTNYLMDDENYFMGQSWREIFQNPENHTNEFIKNNYVFKERLTIPANQTYENSEGVAVLFIKK